MNSSNQISPPSSLSVFQSDRVNDVSKRLSQPKLNSDDRNEPDSACRVGGCHPVETINGFTDNTELRSVTTSETTK